MILYSAFGIITGLVIGYVSSAVGYIVGKAMRMGSRGIGGRRYQISTVILTYAAVSLSAIPVGISQYVKEKKEKPQMQVQKVRYPPRNRSALPRNRSQAQLQPRKRQNPRWAWGPLWPDWLSSAWPFPF